MNSKSRLYSLLACTLAATMCLAQGGGPQRGGGRGGFNSARLLRRHDVQTDLGLTTDQISKLDALRTASRGQRGAGGTPTAEERAARQARAAEIEKQVEAILTDDQKARVKEIAIQLAGDAAVTQPEVQTAIGITPDQKAQIEKLQATMREANASIRQKMQDQSLDRTSARASMQKNNETFRADLHKILTPDQVDKLTALGGKHFEADSTQNRGRRGGGG